MIRTYRRVAQPIADVEFLTERNVLFNRPRLTATFGRDIGTRREIVEIPDEEVVDLTIDGSEIQRSPLKEGEYALASLRVSSDVIRPNSFIQVHSTTLGSYKINFILVKVIARDYQGNTIIRGIPFTRTRNMTNKLSKKLNEVCKVIHLEQGGSANDPGLVDVKIESVVKVRELTMTNTMWPEHSQAQFSDIRDQDERRRAIEAMGTLVCRWQFTIISVTQGRQSKPVEEVISRITEDEVKPQHLATPQALSASWRGGRVLGGS